MKIKEMCELVGIEYDVKNPKRSLNKLKQLYIIEQVGKRDYNIIRDLTEDEQIIGKKLTNCRQLLEDVVLSSLNNNTLRMDMKGFLELFGMVNNKYRYFVYRRMTEEKYKLLEGFEDMDMENGVLCDYVEDVNSILYRLVKQVFKKLESDEKILIKEHMLFGKKYRITNEDGSVAEFIRVIQASNTHHEEYIRLFRQYAQEMGYDIENRNMNNKIKKQIENKVCRDMGMTYIYFEYELINKFNNNNKIDNQNLSLLREKLNKNIIHKLNLSTEDNLKYYSQRDKEKYSEFLIKI